MIYVWFIASSQSMNTSRTPENLGIFTRTCSALIPSTNWWVKSDHVRASENVLGAPVRKLDSETHESFCRLTDHCISQRTATMLPSTRGDQEYHHGHQNTRTPGRQPRTPGHQEGSTTLEGPSGHQDIMEPSRTLGPGLNCKAPSLNCKGPR